MQGGGQGGRFQFEAVMQGKLQRQAQKVLFDIAADLFDELECVAVAAEQDVLAVVQLRTVVTHAARASAKLFGALEYGDRNTALGKRDRRRHARIAAADDAYIQFLSHVL